MTLVCYIEFQGVRVLGFRDLGFGALGFVEFLGMVPWCKV